MSEARQIDAALAKMQGELTSTAKGATGQVGGKSTTARKYGYSTIADVWDAIRKPLSANGLSITQTEGFHENLVTLATTLRHISGETIEGVRPIFTVDKAINDPQGYGSALTYARRYGITAMVGIAPADDDDGKAAQTAGHQSMGTPVQKGPKGGKPKPERGESQIALEWSDRGDARAATYPFTDWQNIALFLDDLAIAVAADPTAWDTNSNDIERVREKIVNAPHPQLIDKLTDIELQLEQQFLQAG